MKTKKHNLAGLEKHLADQALKGFERFGIDGIMMGNKLIKRKGKDIIVEEKKR